MTATDVTLQSGIRAAALDFAPGIEVHPTDGPNPSRLFHFVLTESSHPKG